MYKSYECVVKELKKRHPHFSEQSIKNLANVVHSNPLLEDEDLPNLHEEREEHVRKRNELIKSRLLVEDTDFDDFNEEIAQETKKAQEQTTNVRCFNPLNEQDPNDLKRTKLHKAVRQRNLHEVSKLIAAGASKDIEDACRFTPLVIAKMMGFHEITQWLTIH